MATNNSNVSSKYEDFISKSVLLRSGSPAVYQLETKKENIGILTRKTAGERNVNKINKTILLVGETGAGKSGLINALVNYTMGVKWEDEVWFQIVDEEERKENQTESQTSDVIIYEVFGLEGETLPYSLTIIDTPGFGNTRGAEHDEKIIKKLLDLFKSQDGVHEVNAVGLVMKASENRLTDRQRYIFNSVMSLFGKNMEKSIVALITHSEGMPPENALQALEAANIKCTTNDQPFYFLFSNEQNTQREEKTEAHLKHSWDLTNEGMREFTAFVEKAAPQKLMTTVEVLNDRVRLRACIQNLKERIVFEAKQTEEDKNKMKNLKQPIKGGMWGFVFYEAAVCCTVCKETCHYPGCTMARKPAHCEVMKDGRCTVCTNKCPASDHVKEKWRYVNRKKTEKKNLKDMKQKYVKNQEESEKELSLFENLNKEMDQLTAEKRRLLEKVYQHVVRLNQIALKAESVFTYVHLDFLIEKMKEERYTEKVQELEEMKRKMDEGTKEALNYFVAPLTAFDNKVGNILMNPLKT